MLGFRETMRPMPTIQPRPLPSDALLNKYSIDGAFTDCYAVDIDGTCTHAQYVTAFYTTALFGLERFILRWAVSRPSTDDEVKQLAAGTRDTFAAWHVEARSKNQLLLCDFQRRTRSWLMVAPIDGGTRLYFGSAVVPRKNAATGARTLGVAFRALLGFHKLYSRLLLGAAAAKLKK